MVLVTLTSSSSLLLSLLSPSRCIIESVRGHPSLHRFCYVIPCTICTYIYIYVLFDVLYLSLSLYIYIYVCVAYTYIDIYVYTYMYMYVYVCVYIYIYCVSPRTTTYWSLQLHAAASVSPASRSERGCIHVRRTYTHMYTCVYIYIYVCVCMYAYIYICIYISLYTVCGHSLRRSACAARPVPFAGTHIL